MVMKSIPGSRALQARQISAPFDLVPAGPPARPPPRAGRQAGRQRACLERVYIRHRRWTSTSNCRDCLQQVLLMRSHTAPPGAGRLAVHCPVQKGRLSPRIRQRQGGEGVRDEGGREGAWERARHAVQLIESLGGVWDGHQTDYETNEPRRRTYS